MKKIDKINYALVGILIAMVFCLADLTAEYVAGAIYPITRQEQIERS